MAIRSVVGIAGNATARSQPSHPRELDLDAATEALGQGERAGGFGVWRQDCELLATDPPHVIDGAGCIQQHQAQPLKRPIARLVAICIVEPLEAVEIQHHDAQAELPPPCPRQFGVESILEGAPVEQSGQGVRASRGLQLLQDLPHLASDPAHDDRDDQNRARGHRDLQRVQ